MTSDSPSHGMTPEETTPEEEEGNSPQEDDEWDELEAMSRDEEEFMRKTVPYTRQREDGMIEIPLPFKFEKPCFPYNRGKALQRTKITLENLRRQNPKMFQSSLDKFQKNLETSTPRFVPVPPELKNNNMEEPTGFRCSPCGKKRKPALSLMPKHPPTECASTTNYTKDQTDITR